MEIPYDLWVLRGAGILMTGAIWLLAGRAGRALREHLHQWDEHRIGAALLRRICRECGELRIGREPYHGISLANRERAVLFELRPSLIARYTKPRFLEIIHGEAGTAFGRPHRRAS